MDDLITAALAPIRADAPSSVLLFDFDGTLSPVVDDPAAAVPGPGVVDLVGELATSYRCVGVVSGRPVAFLQQFFDDAVTLSGLYGLESVVGGAFQQHPDADRWRSVVAQVAAEAEAAAAPGQPLDGMVVEPKGLSITMHVRTRPDLADGVAALAQRLSDQSGLVMRSAKMSVELHPPIAADKGTVVRSLAEGAGALLYLGDDIGDLPAFEAAAALRSASGDGVPAVLAVAVGGPELPDEVRAAVDLVLPDQGSVSALLAALRP